MPTSTWQLSLLLRRAALLLPLLCLSLLAQAQTFYFSSGSLSYQTSGATNREVQFKVRETFSQLGRNGRLLRIGSIINGGTLDFGDGTPPQEISLTVTELGSVSPGPLRPDYCAGELTISHSYAEAGSYTATLRGGSRVNGSAAVFSALVGVGAANDSPVSSPPPLVVLASLENATYQVPATDPNGDALTYRLATAEETGDASRFTNPPQLSINPRTGLLSLNSLAYGPAYFTAVVKVSDGQSTITVDQLVEVLPFPNAAPVFTAPTPPANRTIRVAAGQPVTFTVRATDADAGDLVLVGYSLPAGAILTPTLPTRGNPVQATFTWTPTAAQAGVRIAEFGAQDIRGAEAIAQVVIDVTVVSPCDPRTTAPVAVIDQLSTATGSTLTFTAAQLLANDIDLQDRALQVGRVSTPSRGRLVTNADGSYTYTPDPGFVGPVSLSYQLQLAGPVLASAATGHYYEFVSAPGISWTAARAAAAARTYQGQQGYLATVTSVSEKDALVGRAAGQYWFGASDAAVEGEWRWQTGPEAGQLFWRGAATSTALGYSNWLPNQPDDFKNLFRRGGEDYGQLYGQSGLWNDLDERGAGGRLAGYVVEYGGLEACTPVLFATGTITVGVTAAAALNRGGLVAPANATAAPAKAGLEAAPNPSSGQFRLRVTAAQDGPAQLDLYDLQGRRVKVVFAGSLRAGETRELPVEAPELAAGVYLVRLQSGRQVQHLRIAVHK